MLSADVPARAPDVPDGADRRGTAGLWFGVPPGTVLRVGLPAVVLIAVVSLTVRVLWYGGERDGVVAALLGIVDVDREGSVPAWVSTTMLVLCAASLWTVAGEVRARGGRWAGRWRLLAFAFLYLSVDEAASLHERAIEPVREALDLGGALYYSWVVVAVPLVVLLGLVLVPFLRDLPRRTLVAFAVSGATYLGGAVGMEMVGGLIASDGGADTLRLHVAVTVEELLELVGTTLFLAAVNDHRRRLAPAPREPVSRAGEPSPASPGPGSARRSLR